MYDKVKALFENEKVRGLAITAVAGAVFAVLFAWVMRNEEAERANFER